MTRFGGIRYLSGCLPMIIVFTASSSGQEVILDDLQELLRGRIEASGIPPAIMVGEEMIYASIALPVFYEKRAYNLAWSDENGPTSLADSLVLAIEGAYDEGLNPHNYHLRIIARNLQIVRRNIHAGIYNPIWTCC